jgi:cytochrome P450
VIIVTSKKHIAEFCEVTCLSQQAVYADMFGFKHTMVNLEHDRIDDKVIRNRFNNRLLEVKGPAHLETLYPHFVSRFEDSWNRVLKNERNVKGGDTSLPAANICRHLSTRMISLVFFGEKLTSDENFIGELMQYSRDMVNCMIAFQLTPKFLSSFFHRIVTRDGKAMNSLLGQFTDIMGPGRAFWNEAKDIKECTIIHNMTILSESSSYWTSPAVNAQNMLGLWFAASHQPWMNLNFILLEVCARQDWQKALRREIEDNEPLNEYKKLDRLPLLDSFMKETVRVHPLDTCKLLSPSST